LSAKKLPRNNHPSITTLFTAGGVRFRFQKRYINDVHSFVHLFGSMFLCFLIGCFAILCHTPRPELWGAGMALAGGVLWEFGDGFKPLWDENPYGDWRDTILRADGLSWSDIVFDIYGVVLGIILLQHVFHI
jgi:hypothetical protein